MSIFDILSRGKGSGQQNQEPPVDPAKEAVVKQQQEFVNLCIRSAPDVRAAREERRLNAPKEFVLLCHRLNIKKVQIHGNSLLVETAFIRIRGHRIGVLQTQLNGVEKTHKVTNLTLPNGCPHPHISTLGSICWGKDDLKFTNILAGGYLYKAQCMIMDTLENINDHGEYTMYYQGLEKYPLDEPLINGDVL